MNNVENKREIKLLYEIRLFIGFMQKEKLNLFVRRISAQKEN